MFHAQSWLIAAACLCLICGPVTPVHSQSISGDILGTVSDQSGSVVPGAKIILTAVGTGSTLTATSDDGGNYLFAQLKPGHYRLEASKEGFQTGTISDIELLVGQE